MDYVLAPNCLEIKTDVSFTTIFSKEKKNNNNNKEPGFPSTKVLAPT